MAERRAGEPRTYLLVGAGFDEEADAVDEHVDGATESDVDGEQQQLGIDAHDCRCSVGEGAHPIGRAQCRYGNVEMGTRTERLLLFGSALKTDGARN